MRYAIISSLIVGASAHCVVTSIQGANGVTMPGLSGKAPSHPRRPKSSEQYAN